MIGDTEFDILMGRAAESTSRWPIGVSWRLSSAPGWKRPGPIDHRPVRRAGAALAALRAGR